MYAITKTIAGRKEEIYSTFENEQDALSALGNYAESDFSREGSADYSDYISDKEDFLQFKQAYEVEEGEFEGAGFYELGANSLTLVKLFKKGESKSYQYDNVIWSICEVVPS